MVRPWILLSTAGRIARPTQEELYRIDHIFSRRMPAVRARAIGCRRSRQAKAGKR